MKDSLEKGGHPADIQIVKGTFSPGGKAAVT